MIQHVGDRSDPLLLTDLDRSPSAGRRGDWLLGESIQVQPARWTIGPSGLVVPSSSLASSPAHSVKPAIARAERARRGTWAFGLVNFTCIIKKQMLRVTIKVVVPEWLSGMTRNHVGFARAGSNPADHGFASF